MGEDSIHEGTNILAQNIIHIIVKSAQLFGYGGIIETSVKCIYGVSCIFVPVCIHVFMWSSKRHFGLQRGVRVHGKSLIYSSDTMKGHASSFIRGIKGGVNVWEHTKLGNFSFNLIPCVFLPHICMFYSYIWSVECIF